MRQASLWAAVALALACIALSGCERLGTDGDGAADGPAATPTLDMVDMPVDDYNLERIERSLTGFWRLENQRSGQFGEWLRFYHDGTWLTEHRGYTGTWRVTGLSGPGGVPKAGIVLMDVHMGANDADPQREDVQAALEFVISGDELTLVYGGGDFGYYYKVPTIPTPTPTPAE